MFISSKDILLLFTTVVSSYYSLPPFPAVHCRRLQRFPWLSNTLLTNFFYTFNGALDSLVECLGDDSYNQDHSHDYGKGNYQEES